MISIIIPTHNEEKTIFPLLKSVIQAFSDIPKEIIVVDDGSTDNTGSICQPFMLNQEIIYIRSEENKGKGHALRKGLEIAQGSFVAIQDADLEYNPRVLSELYNEAQPDLVIYGKRDRKQGYFWTIMGSAFLSSLCNLLYKSHLFDIYTCYKIIPKKIMEQLSLVSDGFEIEAEITAKLLKRNVKIEEISILYTPRTFKEGKHIRLKDAVLGAWTLVKLRF